MIVWLLAALVQFAMATINAPYAFGAEHNPLSLIAFGFCLAMAVASLSMAIFGDSG